MGETKIQWADYTFNPWIGCTKVNSGCTNCYAEVARSTVVRRVKWGPFGSRSKTSEQYWKQPLTWDRKALNATHCVKRPRVFCGSLCDVFEDWQERIVDHHGRDIWYKNKDGTHRFANMNDLRRDLFALIDRTPNLDWLLLTKRPENIRKMMVPKYALPEPREMEVHQPIPNLWLGTSVSDQETADKAIPEKCRDLAPVLFLSVEPLIGPVNLRLSTYQCPECGFEHARFDTPKCVKCGVRIYEDGTFSRMVDWCIVGGESGPKARPCEVQWIRSIINQCSDAGVPCFVKQLGAKVIDHDTTSATHFEAEQCWPQPVIDRWRLHNQNDPHRIPLNDNKGGDPSEWPEDLRIREFPSGAAYQRG